MAGAIAARLDEIQKRSFPYRLDGLGHRQDRKFKAVTANMIAARWGAGAHGSRRRYSRLGTLRRGRS